MTGAEKISKAGSSANELRPLSLGAKQSPESIRFGSPSNMGTTVSESGSEWSRLLKQTASGGVASALGLGDFGGLGSIVSGIMSLFGGGNHKGVPPPLVRFELPGSQEQTLVIDSTERGTNQANAPQPASSVKASSPLNSSLLMQQQQAQIVQAVKSALLNSSSLNDVIAEI